MKALILVDIQNDFVPGGALAVKDGDVIIPLVNKIQEAFDCIVATQDFHPPNHKSFAANHPQNNIGDVITLQGLPQILWPVHCVQGQQGSSFVATLNMERVQKIFHKGTDPEIDSYSGFFDNGKQKATGMGEYLLGLGVNEVYIVGLATDYCVKFTALDALSLGFKTYLIVDACRGVNLQPLDVESAISEMERAGVSIIHSQAIL